MTLSGTTRSHTFTIPANFSGAFRISIQAVNAKGTGPTTTPWFSEIAVP